MRQMIPFLRLEMIILPSVKVTEAERFHSTIQMSDCVPEQQFLILAPER
jgi:hypothetical protein